MKPYNIIMVSCNVTLTEPLFVKLSVQVSSWELYRQPDTLLGVMYSHTSKLHVTEKAQHWNYNDSCELNSS